MTESLPGTAPLGEPAVPSAEETAPGSSEEVGTEVAHGEDVVPAARFNGLMGRFNRTQNELQQALERIAELEATPPAQEESQMTDANPAVEALQNQVSQLTQMLMAERLESAKQAAIKEYPGAAAFADLIIADSPEAVKDMARVLHERVTAQAPPANPPAEGAGGQTQEPPAPQVESAEPPAATPPPVVSGGTTIDSAPSQDADQRVVEAIKNKNFSAFLKAAWEKQHGSGELVL